MTQLEVIQSIASRTTRVSRDTASLNLRDTIQTALEVPHIRLGGSQVLPGSHEAVAMALVDDLRASGADLQRVQLLIKVLIDSRDPFLG